MRRRIRLTNRKQIRLSDVAIQIQEDSKIVSLIMGNKRSFGNMPSSAEIKLRLSENQISKTLDFGTIGNPKTSANETADAFDAPSCQLRIISADKADKGRVLGSTDRFTLRPGGRRAEEGMLLFQQSAIAPLIWKLDIRDQEHPIVYIDKAIPGAGQWARNSPVFVGCVLPAIIREIFGDILPRDPDSNDHSWTTDWTDWATKDIMPGKRLPRSNDSQEIEEWIDDLIEAFCRKHDFAKKLVDGLDAEAT